MKTTGMKKIQARLEYLRAEIKAERISQGEVLELQSLALFIPAGDVELLEWAGVPEFPEPTATNKVQAVKPVCSDMSEQSLYRIEKHESKPDWFVLMEGPILRAAGNLAHVEGWKARLDKENEQPDKATPRPWAVYHEQHGVKYIGNNRETAATVTAGERQAADVALILQAVNSYDALVAVAEAADMFKIRAQDCFDSILATGNIKITIGLEYRRLGASARAGTARARTHSPVILLQ